MFGFSGKHFKHLEIPREAYKVKDVEHTSKLEFASDERQLVLTIDDSVTFAFDIQE